jgi:hypothetical protein
MTDHKQFFEKHGNSICVENHGFGFMMIEPTIEQMYQAFKARYQAETYGNRPPEPFDVHVLPPAADAVGEVYPFKGPCRIYPAIEYVDLTVTDSTGVWNDREKVSV